MSSMTLAMLLTLKDLASGPLGHFQNNLQKASQQLMATGAVGMEMGRKIIQGLEAPIEYFIEAEDAALRLDAAMMGANNQSHKLFPEMKKHAVELGNELPGTSRELQQMFAALIKEGVESQDVLDGVGRAAGSLAVITEMGFSAAAKFSGQVSKAARIEAEDMIGFMDTIQRAYHVGVATTDLGYAFARSKGALDQFGITGKKAADDLVPLLSNLIKVTGSGETTGTNFMAFLNNMYAFESGGKAKKVAKDLKSLGIELDIFGKKRQFLGVENMLKQMEKLKKAPIEVQDAFMKSVFGGGQDAAFASSFIKSGVDDYSAMKKQMDEQADLQARIDKILTSLKNIRESAMGAFETLLAGVGESIAPELKAMAEGFGRMSEKILAFTKEHPQLTKMLTLFTLFSGISLVAGGGLLLGIGMLMNLMAPLGAGAGWVATKFFHFYSNLLKIGAWNASAGARLTGWVGAMGSKLGAFIVAIPARFSFMMVRLSLYASLFKAKFASMFVGLWRSLIGFPGMLRGLGSGAVGMGARIASAFVKFPGLILGFFKSIPSLFGKFMGLIARLPGLLLRIPSLLKAIALGFRAIGMAAMANPVGLILGAIAFAALLVYKYWRPIKGFFRGLWRGLKAGLAPLKPAFRATFKALSPIIRPVMRVLSQLWGWIKRLIAPVDDVGGAAEKMGERFGKSIAKIINKASEILQAFVSLPGELLNVGINMAKGLVEGFLSIPIVGPIASRVGAAIAGAKGPKGADTRSPSRATAWIGKMMGAGLVLGMDNSASQIMTAATKMAKAATPKMPALASPAFQSSSFSSQPIARNSAGPGGAGGGINITFAPVYKLGGAPAGVAQQVEASARMSFHEFRSLMNRYKEEMQRPRWS